MSRDSVIDDKRETVTIELPQSVINRVQERLAYTKWDTSAEYVEFVLEDVLSHVESKGENEDLEAIDEAEVESRLEALGYLNE